MKKLLLGITVLNILLLSGGSIASTDIPAAHSLQRAAFVPIFTTESVCCGNSATPYCTGIVLYTEDVADEASGELLTRRYYCQTGNRAEAHLCYEDLYTSLYGEPQVAFSFPSCPYQDGTYEEEEPSLYEGVVGMPCRDGLSASGL